MRLKSEIFVSALMRRVFAAGGFAAIERKGAEEAGAVFIRQHLRDGRENLFCPAPQSFAEDSEVGAERRFEQRLKETTAQQVDALLENELRFDADLWVVELETESVDDLFTLVA